MSNSNFDKVFVNLNAPDNFQLSQKIAGDNNANFNYIFQETKAKCQLKGRGSGFVEINGAESNEMLHIVIEFMDFKSHSEAKTLARNLIETVQQDLQVFLQSNPQHIIQQPAQQQITMMPQPVQSFQVPPPTIIQQQPTQVLQQQNYVPQQIIQQNVPMQQMQIIQQTPINIPPPIRAGAPIVQFQSQPSNIIQGTNAAGQQILFNQPTQQYQLQYVQQPNPQSIQTIQHIIQPSQTMQSIQGIIQSNPNEQQYITVQGSASYMQIPPPIVQQSTTPQVFNSGPQQTISINPEDNKSDSMKSSKQIDLSNELKTNNITQQQTMPRIVTTNVPPPSVLTCPPPQVFNHQQIASQQPIQQFILNTQAWPQQQLQSLPLNSQIQIVTQPQTTLRGGNEILIQQNPPTQQVIATFNPQQTSATHQQFQQIQVQQAAIPQPSGVHQSTPMSQIVQVSSHQPMTFQQQFEMKINASDTLPPQQQQRAVKRKFDGENDNNDSNAFPKTGMGSNQNNLSSVMMKNKNRVSTSSQQQNPSSSSHQMIRTVSSAGSGVVRKNHQKSIYRNSNSSVTVSTANNVMKSVNTATAETKTFTKPSPGNANETMMTNSTLQFYPQQNQNQMGFIMRGPNNQNSRFQSPQNFIHQQFPPPINHNSQFSGSRGQIMSNASIGMYQTTTAPTQIQIMHQQPPQNTVVGIGSHQQPVQHQFIQQQQQQQQQPDNNTANVYQQNNNFLTNPSLGTFNRLPMTMTTTSSTQHLTAGNHQQQQPRFRQW